MLKIWAPKKYVLSIRSTGKLFEKDFNRQRSFRNEFALILYGNTFHNSFILISLFFNGSGNQAPVDRRVDIAIHWINHYYYSFGFASVYPLNSG